MSEGAAEGVGGDAVGDMGDGGSPLSGDQFGDVAAQTAQNPGSGIFAQGFYPWPTAQHPQRRRKRKRKR